MSEFKFKNPTVAIDSANKKERDMMKGIMDGSFKDPSVFDGSNVNSKDLGVWGRADATNSAAKDVKSETVEDDFKYAGASEGFGGNEKEDKIDRLTEVGTEGTETILDSESIKPEIKIDRLTEVGTEGTETILDSENFKEDIKVEKTTEEEKMRAAEIKKESLDSAQEARKAEIKKNEEELDYERKAYLEADFNKNTALSRVRKFFGGIGTYDDERNRNTMKDPELAQFRAYYDAKLMKLQELKLADAKERGATDEDLADIYMNFRGEQKITMATEHDKLKIEKQEGTKREFLKEKILSLANSYKALPTSKKIGIGVLMMAGGAAAAGIGGAAIGAMTSFAAARRIFGGVVAGVTTSLALEARGQNNDLEKLKKDRQIILEQIKNLDPEAKYDLLSKNIGEVVIEDSENSIDKIKNQDIRQLATGAAVGIFVGSGMLGKLMSAGYHEAADYFKSLFSGDELASHMEAAANITNAGKETIKSALGHIEVHDGGDSIEKSLIEYIKAHPEMGIDNPEDAAHTMATDYAKASGVSFDKLNSIYPGTTFDIDPNTHQIINMDAKFMPDSVPTVEPEHVVQPQDQPTQQFAQKVGSNPISFVENSQPTEHVEPKVGSMPSQPEPLPVNDSAEFEKGVQADLGAEKTEVANAINKLESDYNNLQNAAAEAHSETTTALPQVSEGDNAGSAVDNFAKEAEIRENIKLTDNKLHQIFEEKGILESPDTVTSIKNLRMNLFGGSSEAFKNVGELKMDDFLADTKNEISAGDSGKYTEKIWDGKKNILVFSKEVEPRIGETVAHWTLRVVEEVARNRK